MHRAVHAGGELILIDAARPQSLLVDVGKVGVVVGNVLVGEDPAEVHHRGDVVEWPVCKLSLLEGVDGM